MLDRIGLLTGLARGLGALWLCFAAALGDVRAQEVTEPSKADATSIDDEQLNKAIARGIDVLRKGVRNYPTHRDCFSCHHQALPLVAFSLQDRGSAESDLTPFLTMNRLERL